jgi:nucleotide-binding universal stress UspA family protein
MKILVPFDGSEHALEAVRHAIRMVRGGLQASFVLASVQEPVHLYERLLAPDPAALERLPGANGSRVLASGETLMRRAGIDFESEVVAGDAEQKLLDLIAQHQCDAVVMGSRGLGALQGALFGSVSQALLRSSPVPVTIVKRAESDAD